MSAHSVPTYKDIHLYNPIFPFCFVAVTVPPTYLWITLCPYSKSRIILSKDIIPVSLPTPFLSTTAIPLGN